MPHICVLLRTLHCLLSLKIRSLGARIRLEGWDKLYFKSRSSQVSMLRSDDFPAIRTRPTVDFGLIYHYQCVWNYSVSLLCVTIVFCNTFSLSSSRPSRALVHWARQWASHDPCFHFISYGSRGRDFCDPHCTARPPCMRAPRKAPRSNSRWYTEKMTFFPRQKVLFIASPNRHCCGDDFTCYQDNYNCCGNNEYWCCNNWNCHHINSDLLSRLYRVCKHIFFC